MTALSRAASRLSKALDRLFTPASRLDGLKVMVLGLDDHISREVVCALSRQRAKVTAVGDAGEVELLRRDLELLGARATLAPLETIDATEARLMADNLRALGQLPNVIVCCRPSADAPASVLVQALRPTLALHLAQTRPARGVRALGAGASTTRSLAALLDDPGLFDPTRTLSRVRLGGRLFDVRRREPALAARAAPRPTGRELCKAAHQPAAPAIRQAPRANPAPARALKAFSPHLREPS
jgi:hypothetical protein